MPKRLLFHIATVSLFLGCTPRAASLPETSAPNADDAETDRPAGNGEPAAEAAFDRSGIDREVRARLVDVRGCYDNLPPDKAAEGRLVSRFLIDDQGHAIDLEIESEGLDAPELTSCVAGVLRSIDFPSAPAGETIAVTYPFEFRAE